MTHATVIVAKAQSELQITVPVYRVDIDDKAETITFHLYGGRILTWPPDPPGTAEPHPAPPHPAPPDPGTAEPQLGPPDNLIVAAGVGRKTAAAMHSIGIVNLKQMAQAFGNGELHDLMTHANLHKLGTWLDENNLFS